MAMQKQRGVKTDEPFNPKNVEDNMKKGGKVMEKESKKADMKMDKMVADKEIKKAMKEHDAQEHPGKHTKLKLKKGGMDVKKMAKGGVTQSNLRSMGRNMARVANQKSSSRGR